MVNKNLPVGLFHEATNKEEIFNSGYGLDEHNHRVCRDILGVSQKGFEELLIKRVLE